MWSRTIALGTLTLLAGGLPPQSGLAAAAGEIALVEDSDGSINGAGILPNIYLRKAACAFYQEHPDAYDAIFVFTSIPQSFFTNVQQGWPVQQLTQGIGRLPNDETAAFCASAGRLRQAVRMGDLNILPDDPDAQYTGLPMYALSGIELMGHEFGHHWLAGVSFDAGDGVRRCLLRGYEPHGSGSDSDIGRECDGHYEYDFNQHWSYYFNSGSLMYGSMIEDLGGGSFRLTYNQPKYSPLDQYLMGLRAPEEVPPMFLVDTGDVSGSCSLPLLHGASTTVTGQRLDLTIEDVIRAEGPRVPATEPCHWTAAMIVVHAAGAPPSPAQLAKLEAYRQRWEAFYSWATDGRGSFDTTLDSRQAPSCTGAVRADAGPGDAAPADAAGGADAGADTRPAAEAGLHGDTGQDQGDGDGGGCSCSVAASPAAAGTLLPALLGALLIVGRRYYPRQQRWVTRAAS